MSKPAFEDTTPAALFNNAVWTSPEMAHAKLHIKLAGEELADGEGWGLMPLEAAEDYLKLALTDILTMKAFKIATEAR